MTTRQSSYIGALGIAIAIVAVWLGYLMPDKRAAKEPIATMDNYSFCVGVWCANRVLNSNRFDIFTNDNYFTLLHDARHFSQTNGWTRFNNRIGFTGDE